MKLYSLARKLKITKLRDDLEIAIYYQYFDYDIWLGMDDLERAYLHTVAGCWLRRFLVRLAPRMFFYKNLDVDRFLAHSSNKTSLTDIIWRDIQRANEELRRESRGQEVIKNEIDGTVMDETLRRDGDDNEDDEDESDEYGSHDGDDDEVDHDMSEGSGFSAEDHHNITMDAAGDSIPYE